MTQPLCRGFGNSFDWTTIMSNLSLKSSLPLVWVRRETSEASASYLRCRVEKDPRYTPHPAVQRVFHAICANQAAVLLSQKPLCNGGPMGDCIYAFDHLYECSCPPLDRKRNRARQIYEDKIIDRIALLARGTHRIVITVFASGFLFSDLVVIVKLIRYLQSQGWAGKLEFNFIDLKYEPLQAPQSLTEAIREKEAEIAKYKKIALWSFGVTIVGLFALKKLQTLYTELKNLTLKKKTHQYVTEVQMRSGASKAVTSLLFLLQQAIGLSSLVVKTRFFSKAEDYHRVCQIQDKFRCDLLVGSDIDNTDEIVASLKGTTQTSSGAGIILVKINDQPVFIEWPRRNSRSFSQVVE